MPQSDTALQEKQREKIQHPRQSRVILLNDDFTPFDFVIAVLAHIFSKDVTSAVSLAQTVHVQGQAVVGVYATEIAETKVDEVHDLARQCGFPLQMRTEEA